MGKNIAYFASAEDDRALRAHIASIGLSILPASLKLLDNGGVYPPPDDPTMGGYLSFRPIEELHPYGSPAVRISDATDPLIQFTRAYYRKPYLVAGRIYWSNDVPELASLTRDYFKQLAKWVRENWVKRTSDGYFFGPNALRLAENAATIVTYFPPAVTIESQE